MYTINSPERETLTVSEVQKVLGLGRNRTYEVVVAEGLAIRVGRRLLIPKSRLQRFLDGNQ